MLYKQNYAKNSKFDVFRGGKVLSLGFLLATNLVMYHTFLIAYINPTKSVTIYINQMGEANLELWLMGFMTILSVIMTYFIIKKEIEEHNAQTN